MQAKYYLSSGNITEISLSSYTIYWHTLLAACVSWRIKNMAKYANSANYDVLEMESGAEYNGIGFVEMCPEYERPIMHFSLEEKYFTMSSMRPVCLL